MSGEVAGRENLRAETLTWECTWLPEDRPKLTDPGAKWEGRVREEPDTEAGEGMGHRELFGFHAEGNGKALGGGDGLPFIKPLS